MLGIIFFSICKLQSTGISLWSIAYHLLVLLSDIYSKYEDEKEKLSIRYEQHSEHQLFLFQN